MADPKHKINKAAMNIYISFFTFLFNFNVNFSNFRMFTPYLKSVFLWGGVNFTETCNFVSEMIIQF